MALTQSSSLMTLGLNRRMGMARNTSVPSLASKVEFSFGRPNHAVRVHTHFSVALRSNCDTNHVLPGRSIPLIRAAALSRTLPLLVPFGYS